MKLSKAESVILLIGTVFASFTAGWFLRGNVSSEPLRLETEQVFSTTLSAGPSSVDADLSVSFGEPEADPSALPSVSVPAGKVNINTADAETLQTLNGIGPKRAADIIAEREANGPFRYPEDLIRVKGIGEATLEKLLDSITTGEETE